MIMFNGSLTTRKLFEHYLVNHESRPHTVYWQAFHRTGDIKVNIRNE